MTWITYILEPKNCIKLVTNSIFLSNLIKACRITHQLKRWCKKRVRRTCTKRDIIIKGRFQQPTPKIYKYPRPFISLIITHNPKYCYSLFTTSQNNSKISITKYSRTHITIETKKPKYFVWTTRTSPALWIVRLRNRKDVTYLQIAK